MGGEGCRLGERVAIGILETPNTGTKDLSSDQGGGTTSHVDDTRSGKVDHADTTEGIGVEGGKEADRGPDGTDDDGINKAGEGKRVAKVGSHLTSLSDGTGDDGSGCSGKGPLEEKGDVVVSGSVVHDEEFAGANESIAVTVREGKSNRPEANSTTTGIEKVLEHNILDVLLTDGSSAKHGKTSLHKEDEGTLLW